MRFEKDEFSFKDEINFMNLNYEIQNQQQLLKNQNTFGFNNDTLYNGIDKEIQ